MKILIVEPSKELAQVLSNALSGLEGVSTAVANTAQLGVSAADEEKPDVILLELLISEHNGLEFIHEFKSYPDWFDIPIVVFSDLSAEELSRAPGWKEDMGIVKHFYKPTTSLKELTEYFASFAHEK